MLPLSLSLCSYVLASHGVDIARMWRDIETHCSNGNCEVSTGSKLDAIANTTDCKGRLLAYEYGLALIPARAPQMESFEALELEKTCGVTPPPPRGTSRRVVLPFPSSDADATYYVDYEHGNDSNDGRKGSPFKTIRRALVATRGETATGSSATMVLAAGVHYLEGRPIQLAAVDSKLTITADPAVNTLTETPAQLPWISGGVPLDTFAKWSKWESPANASYNIWMTSVPLGVHLDDGITGLNTLMKSLMRCQEHIVV
jgi:hypothetical protein